MDFDKGVPIWRQLRNRFAVLIANGVWALGGDVPSVRDLAREYGVNPNTIQKALAELEVEGVVETKRGLGRYVTEDEMLVQRLRLAVAQEAMNDFVQKVSALGLTEKEVKELIESEWKRRKN